MTQAHGYWFDATKDVGVGSSVVTFRAGTAEPVQTHRLQWEPKRLTYETFAGEGSDMALLKRTVLAAATVPVPARERLHVNLWVFGRNGGEPDRVSGEQVTIRDLTFTAAAGT